MKAIEKLIHDTLLALRFFTRLPIPNWFSKDQDQTPKLNEAIIAFPIAGLLIGIIPALVWYVTSQFLSPFLAASLAVFLGTLITGALHEDGLADCADGLGATHNKKRALEIMRDSTVGTYGAVALIFSFAFRISALASLSIVNGLIAILIAHAVARATMSIAIHSAKYIRPSGLGDAVSDGADKTDFFVTIGTGLLIAILLSFGPGIFGAFAAVALAMFAAWAFLQFLKSRLDGYTGDGLGAMEQIAEITILITLAAFWT